MFLAMVKIGQEDRKLPVCDNSETFEKHYNLFHNGCSIKVVDCSIRVFQLLAAFRLKV